MIIARLMGSYKTPRTESHQTIRSYFDELNSASAGLYALKEGNCLDSLLQVFGRLPSAMVFNSDSQMVYRENMENCSWKSFSEIEKENFKNQLIPDQSKHQFRKILNCTRELEPSDSDSAFDYHLLLPWAKYLPAQAKGAFELAKSVQDQSTHNFKVYMINFDDLQEWENRND
jgi:hypothetical protein